VFISIYTQEAEEEAKSHSKLIHYIYRALHTILRTLLFVREKIIDTKQEHTPLINYSMQAYATETQTHEEKHTTLDGES
jgi:hypothetical protein